MERSTVQVMAKRGNRIRQIATALGRSPTTVARVLWEPVDQRPTKRRRHSKIEADRPQIEQGIRDGLSNVRILEVARADPAHPYRGGRTVFDDLVRRLRHDLAQQQAAAAVPIWFEGLPAEYLQVDWGEIRRFSFTQRLPRTRYFLACRLKYSRWSWVWFTSDMRQETLFRGLVACFLARHPSRPHGHRGRAAAPAQAAAHL
jgi:transposase